MRPNPVLTGILCGLGAALCWAAGFVAARHGIDAGLTPVDITVHRYAWAGLVLLPLVLRDGIWNLNGIGWRRGLLLAVLGGPVFSLISYSGLLLVPLGHGGVIQPSCATLGGIVFAVAMLHERLSTSRMIGALIIVIGLTVIGGESVLTIGTHGIAGDLMFVLAGLMFALFGTLLRSWRIPALTAAAVISVLSLVAVPLHAAIGFERMFAIGWGENLLQAVIQGILAGPVSLYLFTRAVTLLGAARGAVFASLVPPLVLLFGWLVLGEPPSALQLVGLVIVLGGFRLAQRG